MSKLIEVKVPHFGEFKDLTVIEVLVNPGDNVKLEDNLITIDSEKVTMEVPAPCAGTVHEMKVKVGDKVSEGSLILLLKPASTGGTTAPHEFQTPHVTDTRYSTKCVFISYRREDSADITGRIYDRLVQHFGRDVIFKDVDSIPLGVDFRQHLAKALGDCGLLLAVIGRGWLTATTDSGKRRLDESHDHLRLEIEAALQRSIPVIPVLVQGASIPTEEDLPASLKSLAFRNGIAVRRDPDFHPDMDRLVKGIQTHLT